MLSPQTLVLALGFLSTTAFSAPTGLALTAERCLAIKSQAGFLRCVNDFSSGELAHAVTKGHGGPCFATSTSTGLTCLDDLNKEIDINADDEPEAVEEEVEQCVAIQDEDGNARCIDDDDQAGPEDEPEEEVHTALLKRDAKLCVAIAMEDGELRCAESKRDVVKRANSACLAAADAETGIIRCLDSSITKRSPNMCVAVAMDDNTIKCAESKRDLVERANSACLARTDALTGLVKCFDDTLSKRSANLCVAVAGEDGVLKCSDLNLSKRDLSERAESSCLAAADAATGIVQCIDSHLSKRSQSSCLATTTSGTGLIKCLSTQQLGNTKRSPTMCLAATDSVTGVVKCMEGLSRRSKRSANPEAVPSASDCLVSSKTTEGLLECLDEVDKRVDHLTKRSGSTCTAVANADGLISCLESQVGGSLNKRNMCLATADATGAVKCVEQDLVGKVKKRTSNVCLATVRYQGMVKCVGIPE